MSAWIVPSTSEERAGQIATNDFGPGMESRGTIMQWSLPQGLVAETEEAAGPATTPWTVEARENGWTGWVAEKFAEV
jgi:hypothetical protein